MIVAPRARRRKQLRSVKMKKGARPMVGREPTPGQDFRFDD
jgi:hypothetical protein